MKNYCGADCGRCSFRESCRGCLATGGSPFGGRCVAAEYCKAGGLEAYRVFKTKLLAEINDLLDEDDTIDISKYRKVRQGSGGLRFMDALLEGGKNGVDIGMTGMTINEERKKSVNFSDSYYNAAQVLVVKADCTTFDNCKTAADVEAILNK